MYTVKICKGGHGPGPPQSQKVQSFCEKGPGFLSRPPTGPAMHKICLIRVKLAIILLNKCIDIHLSIQSFIRLFVFHNYFATFCNFVCICFCNFLLELYSNFGNYFRQFMITFN